MLPDEWITAWALSVLIQPVAVGCFALGMVAGMVAMWMVSDACYYRLRRLLRQVRTLYRIRRERRG